MRLLQRERTSSRGSESDAGELTGETLTSLVDVSFKGSYGGPRYVSFRLSLYDPWSILSLNERW